MDTQVHGGTRGAPKTPINMNIIIDHGEATDDVTLQVRTYF